MCRTHKVYNSEKILVWLEGHRQTSSLEIQKALPLLEELEDGCGHLHPLRILVRMPLPKKVAEVLRTLFLGLNFCELGQLSKNLFFGQGYLWRLFRILGLRWHSFTTLRGTRSSRTSVLGIGL